MKTEVIYIHKIKETITFYIGKNAKDNFDVIDMGEPNDLWFHSNEESSCHVVAKIPEDIDLNKKKMLTIIKKGALLCKENTNKLKSLSTHVFMYTCVKNVIKTDIPGTVHLSEKAKLIDC
jgi:predicted ribosome quality control (RQC) complex YloA/Tae2 family protein